MSHPSGLLVDGGALWWSSISSLWSGRRWSSSHRSGLVVDGRRLSSLFELYLAPVWSARRWWSSLVELTPLCSLMVELFGGARTALLVDGGALWWSSHRSARGWWSSLVELAPLCSWMVELAPAPCSVGRWSSISHHCARITLVMAKRVEESPEAFVFPLDHHFGGADPPGISVG